MLNDLIKIADMLDALGLKSEAKDIDSIIKQSAERSAAVDKFVADLKRSYKNVSESSVFPTINKKSLPEIIQVIDILLEHSKASYIGPSVSSQQMKDLIDRPKVLAEGIITIEEDIEDIQSELLKAKNYEETKTLQNEERDIRHKLQTLWEEVKSIQSGQRIEDKENFQKFVKQYDELKKKRIVQRYKPLNEE